VLQNASVTVGVVTDAFCNASVTVGVGIIVGSRGEMLKQNKDIVEDSYL